MSPAISEEYLSSLLELTFNSRPQINMLTMLAEDYYADAASIAYTIETHLAKTQGDKLHVLYLVDSIVKNVGKDYVELFSRNLPSLFARVFSEADYHVKSSLYKLRTTWESVFSKERLANLDTLVNNLDPGWPVVVRPSNIHVNPDFIKGGSDRCAAVRGDIMREKILKEKKELLELKKKKVELELMQTKEVLEKEQKKLESFTTTIKGENKPPSVLPDSSSLNLIEKLQPSSSSLKDIESENSKKLMEVSIRDPRRKTRQTDLSVGSPLSGGTCSPIPGSGAMESNSPYHSEDSRDRPPRRKYKSKEKKRLRDRDKEVVREHKKPYKPKMPEGFLETKRDNGHSYKPSTNIGAEYREVENMVYEDELDSPCDSQTGSGYNLAASDILSTKVTAELMKHMAESANETTKPVDTVQPSLKSDGHSEVERDVTKSHPAETESTNTVRHLMSQPNEVVRSPAPSLKAQDQSPIIDSNKTTVSDEKVKTSLEVLPEEVQLQKIFDSVHAPSSSSTPFSPNVGNENSANDLIFTEAVESVEESQEEEKLVCFPSKDPIGFEESTVKPVADSYLEGTGEENSDLSNKVAASKRKFDLEDEDNEMHKKRLISVLEDSESPLSVEAVIPEQALSPSCLVAPPAPSIPPLIDPCNNELGSTIEKQPEPDVPKPPVDPPLSSPQSLVTSEETGKDVDLRLLLPRPIDRVKEEVKINEKTELTTISLFGGEDVDYRQKPPQADFNMPSPPPPPVIGNLHEVNAKKSWAQIKDRKTEERSPKSIPDRMKRSSISQARPSPQKESSRQNSEAHCTLLIREAKKQLQNGNISFVEYNKMLQEVVSINEERIFMEAKARYSDIPSSTEEESVSLHDEVDSSFECDRLEESRETENLRESAARLGEPPGLTSNMMEPPLVPHALPRQAQLPEEPFRRDRPDMDRFEFPDRRIVSDSRERQPPPPSVPDNFPRQRPPMPQCPPFAGLNVPFPIMGFRPRMPRNIPPILLPQVSMHLLMEADRERLDNISIGRQVRQVRFYGTTAVVLLSWDDPREVIFPAEQRSLFVDKRHEFVLRFGDSPTEITIDGMSSRVQLGAPTRELYIDNKFYSIQFGGLPIEVLLCGRVRSVCLGSPPPIVRFGPVKCIDLVAGSVTLYVNAKTNFQFYLDAKPQKFHIEGEPCVLQFADALQTVLINGVVIPLEFDGFPVPVIFRGIHYFLRLTGLPYGIIPGQISIMNMESFAHPPTPMLAPPPMPHLPIVDPTPPQVFLPPQVPPVMTHLMNPPSMPSAPTDMSSTAVEPPVVAPEESRPDSSSQETNNLDINDLFKKLIQTGILPTHAPEPPETKVVPEVEADFSKSESLKSSRPSLISKLYSGIQCSSCGIRFPPEGTKMYSRHLDWHFRQNKREKHSTKKPQCRGWYYDFPNWMQYQELDDPDDNDPEHLIETKEEETEEDMPSVPVGHRKDVECRVCREKFEEFFDHETEEWQARNALLVDDSFYHPLCYEEFKNKKEEEEVDVVPEEEGPPLEDPSIEFIDLDDSEVPSPVPSPEGESLPLLGPEKVDSPEVITLDDISDDKSELEAKVEEKEKDSARDSEDDDIIDIIPIERKIESVELLDDDEDDKPPVAASTIDKNDLTKADEEKEEEFDFTKVTVKQEKDRVVAENVDSSQPTYTATIDGNIVHETAAPLVLPTKIKINIHRSSKQVDGVDVEPSGDSNDAIALNQPPPPGEETVEPPASSVKPKLVGVELTAQPMVDQGVELSGLCSIM